jgi:peptidoglycan/xylan/chitin deacetylase (PgdA/CDA1 family)
VTVTRVALTFDAELPDRPSGPGIDVGILDTLERLGVPATFFLQGRWAEAAPEVARRIATDGHLVGSHGHYHAEMPLLTDEGLDRDLRAAAEAILAATGADPRPWFRCPFGTGVDDPRVLGAIERGGYRHVGWDVSGEDWRPDRSAADVRDEVIAGSRRHGDGAVVLLHSWPDRTLAALEGIVVGLRASGVTLVRLDALDAVTAGIPGDGTTVLYHAVSGSST